MSDAVRVILDSGATLLLDRVPGTGLGLPPDMVRAIAATPAGHEKGGMRLTFDIEHVVTEDRVDKALSSLVERLLIGDSGVEVTEWTVPDPQGADNDVPFGRFSIELFKIDDCTSSDRLVRRGETKEEAMTRLLLSGVEAARKNNSGLIHATVIHSADGSMAGRACTSDSPEPPVGATLVARRKIGGQPCVDIQWDQIDNGLEDAVQHAVARLRKDCAMVGIDLARSRLEMLLMFDPSYPSWKAGEHGPKSACMTGETDSIPWRGDDMLRTVTSMAEACRRDGGSPKTLKIRVLR